MKATVFKVNWDNGMSACGTFADEFEVYAEADAFGRGWQAAMCAVDGYDPASNDHGYSYDVIEVEVEVPDDGELCKGLPEYNGWKAYYEYPGFIHYVRDGQDIDIWASSDFNGSQMLDIQVQTADGWVDDGNHGYSGGGNVPWPYVGRTAERMFALIRPFLDEYTGVNHVHHCTRCGAKLEGEIEAVCSNPGEGCCPPLPEGVGK